MQYMNIARTSVLTLSIVLGLPAFGLIVHWTQGSNTNIGLGGVTYDFEVVGLLAGVLGVLLWPVMLVVPIFRKNVYFLNVIFELTAFLVFWVLWMTTAILVIQWRDILYPPPFDSCDFILAVSGAYCREFFAIQGLTITIFVITMLYLIALLVFALVSQSRGRPIWKTSVTDLDANNNSNAPPQNNFTLDSYSQSPAAPPSSYGQPTTYNQPMTSTNYPATSLPNPSATGVTTPLFQQSTQMPNLPQV